VNLVGALRRSKFKNPNSFQKHRENQKKKIMENREFLRKNRFLTKSILVFGVTLKQMTVDT